MQSLALDVKVLTESGDELVIREFEEEEEAADNEASRIDSLKSEALEEIDFSVDDDEDEDDEFDLIKSIFDEEEDEDGFNSAEEDEDGFEDEDDLDDEDDFGFGNLFADEDDEE